MVKVGDRLHWTAPHVADKHCIGGLPGNRTSMIVVPIIAAAGLVIPKTSSRAITSPAGTADAMETLTRVDLSIAEMRQVVEREGGCVVWGGAMQLSPADDILIGVERPLDFDSEGQLVASVLSKKIAAGSTHVVIDIPVGATAKLRTMEAAARLEARLWRVAEAFGLKVRIVRTDGAQPVGRGIGPALEARDVLAVLQNASGAPSDLAERAVDLSSRLLELIGACEDGVPLRGICSRRGPHGPSSRQSARRRAECGSLGRPNTAPTFLPHGPGASFVSTIGGWPGSPSWRAPRMTP
jgi:thymidine phosphorylase